MHEFKTLAPRANIDGIYTQTHIFPSANAAPLIYHVFNVEQDQVIRDNKFDIRAGMESEATEHKTKATQSHELSRKLSMAPTGFFFSHIQTSLFFDITFGYDLNLAC